MTVHGKEVILLAMASHIIILMVLAEVTMLTLESQTMVSSI